MGGVIILVGLLVSVIFWADLSNVNILFCIYIVVSFGLLGAFDDYKKIKHSNSSGISSKLKILIQIFLAILGVSFFVYFLFHSQYLLLLVPLMQSISPMV